MALENTSSENTNSEIVWLTIDVYSDIVCPWCFIGKRQLESAIAEFELSNQSKNIQVLVRWRAFQLNPDLPEEGMSRLAYLQKKFGQSDPSAIYARVKQAGQQVGLAFNIEAITRQPNTKKGHALVEAAFQQGGAELQGKVKEALLSDYFFHAGDLTNDAHLIDLSTQAGLSKESINTALTDTKALASVTKEDIEAREAGISGVPFFIFNRKIAVSGAQGSQTLLDAMTQASSQ